MKDYEKNIVKTNAFFESIMEKVEIPTGLELDYAIPDKFNVEELLDDEFDIVGCLKFGGCEGIYLDIILEGNFDKACTEKRLHIGTIKTLSTSDDAFKKMTLLMAEFTIKGRNWMNDNQNLLLRRGYCVQVKKDGEYVPWLICTTLERAMEIAKKETEDKKKEIQIFDLYYQKIVD